MPGLLEQNIQKERSPRLQRVGASGDGEGAETSRDSEASREDQVINENEISAIPHKVQDTGETP